MRQITHGDGNIFSHLDGRALDSQKLTEICGDQVSLSHGECSPMRALQMHSSLVQRLSLDTAMKGHQGCVNALAWNSSGSLLLSGSDDTRVNIWDYGSQMLLHSIYSGHSANIFCTKFMPETGDDVVVSAAGDAEVRVHRVSRSGGDMKGNQSLSEQTAIFRCHARRVKKLAVEDGNPHVIWSASEDGTLRQHDLRESVRCPTHGASVEECRNVLVDLRSGAKKSLLDSPRHCLSLKTCAISPTRPHHLLIGGSDAFARLYDRRMLPPLTSSQQAAKSPPCVCYFCPAHLSEYSRSSLHLTHVTFSPNGEEVLLSYSGEHVYLMGANNSQDVAAVYAAGDVPKRTVLTPFINGTKGYQRSQIPGSHGCCQNFPWVKKCRELFENAKSSLEQVNDFLHAIEATSEIIDAGGPAVDAGLRHDCLCLRATAFLKRAWKNDAQMALRDCNEARAMHPNSVIVHHTMAEVLLQLGRHRGALEFAMRAHNLDPSDVLLSEHVAQLRAQLMAEEARNRRSNEGDTKSDRKMSRSRTISNLLFRSDSDKLDSFEETWREERDDAELFDEDLDIEMELEMSLAEEGGADQDEGSPAGPSLNLRPRPKIEVQGRFNRSQCMGSTSSLGTSKENHLPQVELAVDMRQRYVGHCNTGTDIKQASFLGERGEYVASGSDDGRWFIWAKKTGKLVRMLAGDENVVNCVQSHPFDCAVATSGIDNTIKLWTPRKPGNPMVEGETSLSESDDFLKVMVENQHRMQRQGLWGNLGENGRILIRSMPMEFLQRFRVQDSSEGAVHPFECTQS